MSRKEKIPSAVRNTVWLRWVSDKNNAKCYCCKLETITTANWHCGHVISEKNGGAVHLNNLRPICAGCNCSMGKTDMFDFMHKYGFDTIGNSSTNDAFLKKLESKQVQKPVKKPTKKQRNNSNVDKTEQIQKKYDSLKKDYDKLLKKHAELEEEYTSLEKITEELADEVVCLESEEKKEKVKVCARCDTAKINIENINIENPISVFNYGIKHKFDYMALGSESEDDIESKEYFEVFLMHYFKKNNTILYKKQILENYKNMRSLGFDSFDKIYGYVRTITEFMRGFGPCSCFDLTLELCKKLKTGSKSIYLINDNARNTATDSFQLKLKTRKIYGCKGMEDGEQHMVLRDSFQLKYVHRNEFLKALSTPGAKTWITNVLGFQGQGCPRRNIKKLIARIKTLNSLEILEMLRYPNTFNLFWIGYDK